MFPIDTNHSGVPASQHEQALQQGEATTDSGSMSQKLEKLGALLALSNRTLQEKAHSYTSGLDPIQREIFHAVLVGEGSLALNATKAVEAALQAGERAQLLHTQAQAARRAAEAAEARVAVLQAAFSEAQQMTDLSGSLGSVHIAAPTDATDTPASNS